MYCFKVLVIVVVIVRLANQRAASSSYWSNPIKMNNGVFVFTNKINQKWKKKVMNEPHRAAFTLSTWFNTKQNSFDASYSCAVHAFYLPLDTLPSLPRHFLGEGGRGEGIKSGKEGGGGGQKTHFLSPLFIFPFPRKNEPARRLTPVARKLPLPPFCNRKLSAQTMEVRGTEGGRLGTRQGMCVAEWLLSSRFNLN